MLTAAAVLLALLSASVSGTVADDRSVQILPSGSIMEIETFGGVPKWRLLPHLFSEKTVNVTCPGVTDFSVYAADEPEKLVERVQQRRAAWCGLIALLTWDSPTCVTRISPFHDTAVAVVHPRLHGRHACVFHVSEQFSAWQLGRGLLGAVLFLQAGGLVNSIYFRLTTGTSGFVLLSLLILAFIIYRSVPNKKAMAASLALFGSTIVSLGRYFVGSWFPSLEELMYNKWVGLYLAASALVGLSVTYYYDDPTNAKLNTILERGLQLGGLALVATSTSLPEASITAAALLLVSRVFWPHLPRVPGLSFVWQRAKQLMGGAPAPPLEPQPGPLPPKVHRHRRPADLVEELEHRRHGTPTPSRLTNGREGSSDAVEACSGEEPSIEETSEATGSVRQAGARHSTDSYQHSGRSELESGEQHTPVVRHPGGRQQGTPQTPISPLIQRGLVYNESTGRTLQIGKPTYNKLIKDGFQVDHQKGVLTPPPGGVREPSGGQRSSTSLRSPRSGRQRKSLTAAAAMALPD